MTRSMWEPPEPKLRPLQVSITLVLVTVSLVSIVSMMVG
jgi:hypothetical protein